MKVDVETAIAFDPITITIETRGEANVLWHLLNMPESPEVIEYFKYHNDKIIPEIKQFIHIKDTMFYTFNNTYKGQLRKP